MPPVPTRKHEPGNKKLKRKRRLDDLELSQSGDIVKYFKPSPTTNTENTVENNNSTVNSGEDDTTADENGATKVDDNGATKADDSGATRADDNGAKVQVTRFEQFEIYQENFGFLFDMDKIDSIDNESLKESCMKLEGYLQHGSSKDIDGMDLFLELKMLTSIVPATMRKPKDVMNFLMIMDGPSSYPNAWVAFRILLTIPVTVASAERAFSKLKLIKNYLRSTMSQERLNGLAMLSIEQAIAENLDFTYIVNEFATKNVQRESTFGQFAPGSDQDRGNGDH